MLRKIRNLVAGNQKLTRETEKANMMVETTRWERDVARAEIKRRDELALALAEEAQIKVPIEQTKPAEESELLKRVQVAEEHAAEVTQDNEVLRKDNKGLRDRNANLVSIISSLKIGEPRATEKVSGNGNGGHKVAIKDANTLPAVAVPDETPAVNNNTIQWMIAGQLQTIPVPKDLTEVKPFVDQYLAGKVELLPCAVNAAKKAIYEDIKLVYQALLLLGVYRDMIVSGNPQEKRHFEEKLKELRLEKGGAVSNKSTFGIRKDYEVQWRGQKRDLTDALKKKKSHNPKHTLRIYFFYDKPSRTVVVGHLPSHLRNQLT